MPADRAVQARKAGTLAEVNAVVLVAKLVLVLVFAVAAVAKLAERTAFRRTLPLYGVPVRLVGAVAIGVPVAELGVAVALIPAELAPWGAIGALLLLVIFTAAAAGPRARAVEAKCDCFGPLEGLSTGVPPFIRNAALAAIAGLAVVLETTAPAADVPASAVAGVALAVAGVAAWLAVSARKGGERRAREPTVGAPAPAAVFRALTGETIDLTASPGAPTLLLFWNPSCPPCQYMLPRLKAWENDRPSGSPRLVIASSGSEDDNRAAGLTSPIVLQGSDEARQAFGIPGRPAAVLVDDEGRVASETLLGAPAILAALGAPLT
jgi:thiol-disulfide isomerase/thioredoxin